MPPEINNSTKGKFSEPEKPDLAFKSSITEAEKSGIPAVIAQAKNEYGSWLMSQAERRYVEAVPLLRHVAQFQTSENNRIGAANTYTMLSSCLFIIGDVYSLKEAEEAAKKAVEFYPDSEDFAELRRTQVIKRITILGILARETRDQNYFNQEVNLFKQYADTLKGSKEVWLQFQKDGLVQAA